MFRLAEEAGFAAVRTAVVPGFRFRDPATRRSGAATPGSRD